MISAKRLEQLRAEIGAVAEKHPSPVVVGVAAIAQVVLGAFEWEDPGTVIDPRFTLRWTVKSETVEARIVEVEDSDSGAGLVAWFWHGSKSFHVDTGDTPVGPPWNEAILFPLGVESVDERKAWLEPVLTAALNVRWHR